MKGSAQTIVIVGGGTAGWLTAGLLAAQIKDDGQQQFRVRVIEPPDIPIIGVGEGTWPTMRSTLHRIGVREIDFLRETNASFKQGSKFCGWSAGKGEFYYHPFEPPMSATSKDAATSWLAAANDSSFSNAVCFQEKLCEQHLAPKTLTSPDFAGVTNYGYHFDAGAMAGFLRRHCETALGVEVIGDRMCAVTSAESGDILAIETAQHGQVRGDFFVDCTGFRSLLLKEHFGVSTKPLSHVLFADRALVAQVPHEEGAPIRSTTMGTAQEAGWIWDIGLATRRGTGYVHSSAHANAEDAEATLRKYLSGQKADLNDLSLRMLNFTSGYLDQFWVNNCAAVGLAAGFVEPLEASSIMLTEQAALELAELLASSDPGEGGAAKRFNTRFTKHWEQVADFLKLHYVLSERPEEFWRDNREAASIPDTLARDLEKWRTQIPSPADFSNRSALFPAESYQYVLYGMLGAAAGPVSASLKQQHEAGTTAASEQADRLAKALPSNRHLLSSVHH